ncbi:MAG: DUF4964 domain-containing protein, partial [Muribaculaceae bacterium]|nr:DUF4964 domain-containing protein [Muribaculaceae bacterium]
MKLFRQLLGVLTLAGAIGIPAIAQTADDFKPYQKNNLRLPSVPLLMNDPYFSIWSNYDNLNGGPTRHWSEKEKAIDGILRVDGVAYRFMGAEKKNILSPIAGLTVDGFNWSGRVNYNVQNNTDWTKTDFNDSGGAIEELSLRHISEP